MIQYDQVHRVQQLMWENYADMRYRVLSRCIVQIRRDNVIDNLRSFPSVFFCHCQYCPNKGIERIRRIS